MRYRKSLAALALVALLTTAGCLSAFTGAEQAAAVQSPTAAGTAATADATTLQVSADGQVGADPDQAIVRVAVVASGPDAATARQRLAENATRMRQALAEAGVSDEQVSTVHYDINRDYRREEDQPTRYRAIHAYRITLNDLDRVGETIDTAVENGASQVDDVRFTLSEDRQRELRKEALQKAMRNARGEAGAIASSANLTVVGVHEVRTTDTGYRPYEQTVAMASADGGHTKIESGSVTVSARVVVVYNATQS
jgi:hypothetical protein